MFLRQTRLSTTWKKFFTYQYTPHLNILRDVKFLESGTISSEALKVISYLVLLHEQL